MCLLKDKYKVHLPQPSELLPNMSIINALAEFSFIVIFNPLELITLNSAYPNGNSPSSAR